MSCASEIARLVVTVVLPSPALALVMAITWGDCPDGFERRMEVMMARNESDAGDAAWCTVLCAVSATGSAPRACSWR